MRTHSQLDGLGRVFRGSDAVRAGALSRAQLRGPGVRRLFQGVYASIDVAVTHELYCAGAGLALPPTAVITGRSAATVRGVALARTDDPVETLVPVDARVVRTSGLTVRRTAIRPEECEQWAGLRLGTPQRMALDLLLDRPLPDAVADLDAVLRAGLVTLPEVGALVEQRSDRGIVSARRAVALADPRAESRPESRVRVWLVLDGLHPQPQYWIDDSRGRLARVDLAFVPQRVAVEYDGGWREGELWALNRDRERLNRVQAAGWEIVFVTAALLRNPERMIRTVRAALARRVA
ncbi:MAG: endonuclease domain-containing protein [Pseudonocardiaceae bacterium]